jgi:triosephosphate isomerase (TIM)
MRKLIVGNWKMNGLSSDLDEIGRIAEASSNFGNVDTGLCLPATLIGPAASQFVDFAIGAQDCHRNESGAHTGCISAAMLKDVGAVMTIIGHSERRTDQGESDQDIQGKARAALAEGLNVIICIGETEAERDAGKAEEIVLGQLAGSVPVDVGTSRISIAYEPVWAIGTGRIPSSDDVKDMHAAIRLKLVALLGEAAASVRILYGGSMNGANADELLGIENVDGGLIGGASLSAEKFAPILQAASNK